MLTRRGLFGGLAGLAAPAIIRTPGLLMPVRSWADPDNDWADAFYREWVKDIHETKWNIAAEILASEVEDGARLMWIP